MYYKALNISDQRKGFKNAIAESSSEVLLLLTFKISNLFNHRQQNNRSMKLRSSHPEVFLEKGVLKICSKFTGVHPCRSVISIKLLWNFIEIALRDGCSLINFYSKRAHGYSSVWSCCEKPNMQILGTIFK